MVKKQATTSVCSDSMFVRKLHSLEDRVYPQYMKCPFASMYKKCAVYEECVMHICKVSCFVTLQPNNFIDSHFVQASVLVEENTFFLGLLIFLFSLLFTFLSYGYRVTMFVFKFCIIKVNKMIMSYPGQWSVGEVLALSVKISHLTLLHHCINCHWLTKCNCSPTCNMIQGLY